MRVLVVLALLGLSLTECFSAAPAPSPSDADGNVLRSIRGVDVSGPFREAGVEIELFSPRAFPVRNEIAVLQIGTHMFLRSRYPASGDTHTLFFFVSPPEFAALGDGDRATMRYGIEAGAAQNWEFGFLDKRRLDRQ
jgi:hypothetical protein